jgi:hypothetical protein
MAPKITPDKRAAESRTRMKNPLRERCFPDAIRGSSFDQKKKIKK